MYILLSQAKPLTDGPQPPAALPEGEENDEPESCSWCGALESGDVKPSYMSEGPKQRRKRKRLQAAEVRPSILPENSSQLLGLK